MRKLTENPCLLFVTRVFCSLLARQPQSKDKFTKKMTEILNRLQIATYV